eukprot:CAMPEP_0194766116 /NCGR_PEP_ID=MMETSP0323_2-20130528/29067_1 /TAXON_ID=2866 ORGANISM="Crypthecodinium cohnii, Strain Seligo" /NCGR_SAMPLE_ID=MMETSP0323_2 /ASSEMBLY_ACC=CAM_ASM_000346 /LENGTH=75 /DNA_ID=CAMNT_0039696661 /DNA_START=174 /DNA_END=401 /DNA_ORIENTATION=+
MSAPKPVLPQALESGSQPGAFKGWHAGQIKILLPQLRFNPPNHKSPTKVSRFPAAVLLAAPFQACALEGCELTDR